MLPKPKTPFKIHFLIITKNIMINIFFLMSFNSSNLDFRGVISIFAELKGVK